jgi:pantoate--beta-alanine ligase
MKPTVVVPPLPAQVPLTPAPTRPVPTGPSPMVTVRTVAALREAVAAERANGRPVAVVPTMGAFHEGHLDLMRRAGEDGHSVVVTLFVNPTQFAADEDLSTYPRDEGRDAAMAQEQGVRILFAPGAREIYPEGFGTTITVAGPSEGFEGGTRPTHFSGVATVVAKLLIAVRPDRAVFGQKDAQQVAVIRRLMRDLHLDDIELVVAPITREADGLAMSSRNAYLGPDGRAAAAALHRGLKAAATSVTRGERDGAAVEAAAAAVISAEPGCDLDYAALVDPDTFHRMARLDGPAVLAVAARVGPARLIDNILLPHPPTE